MRPSFAAYDSQISRVITSYSIHYTKLYDLNGNQLVLTVPGGTQHDLWTTGNEVPRVVQSANNTDFDVVVKFDNGVSQLFEFQGIIVEQDSNNLIRFDFTPIASGTRMFAASFIGGLSS